MWMPVEETHLRKKSKSSLWRHVKFAMVVRHSSGDIKEAFGRKLWGVGKRSRVGACIGSPLHVDSI